MGRVLQCRNLSKNLKFHQAELQLLWEVGTPPSTRQDQRRPAVLRLHAKAKGRPVDQNIKPGAILRGAFSKSRFEA